MTAERRHAEQRERDIGGDLETLGWAIVCSGRHASSYPDPFTNAWSASDAPLTLSLSPSGGEGSDTTPSPSERERAGVRGDTRSRMIRIHGPASVLWISLVPKDLDATGGAG